MKPPVYMISISDNEISQYYKNLVLSSWKDYEVRHFEAITPKDLHKYDYLNFGLKHRLKGKVKVEFTETEKAVWYSHMECWVLARKEPIIVVEHDIQLIKKIDESIFENDMVCLAHSNRKNKLKLAGGAYYITPAIAKYMTNDAKSKKPIYFNSDALIHNVCDKKGVWKHSHCFQIKDDNIGVTVDHNK